MMNDRCLKDFLFKPRIKSRYVVVVLILCWFTLGSFVNVLLHPPNDMGVSGEVWENEYGRLEVTPDTSMGIVRQEQFCNVTVYQSGVYDVAFRFGFPLDLSGCDIFRWSNCSHNVTVYDYGNVVDSFTIVNIENIEVIDVGDIDLENDYILGDIPSVFYRRGQGCYYDPDWDMWYNGSIVVCFDSFQWINSEQTNATFTYEYYGWLGTSHIEERWWMDWQSVKHRFSYMEHGGLHYYFVTGVSMVENVTQYYRWFYNIPRGSSGKWDFLAKRSVDSISEALSSGRYVMIDPWWDSDWDYYKTLSVSDKVGGYQMKLVVDKDTVLGGNLTCEGHCNDNFSDIRFVYDNTTELGYWMENMTSGKQATFWINNSGNYSVFEMFYGNSGVGATSDFNSTFQFFREEFENGADGDDLSTIGWTHDVNEYEIEDALFYRGGKCSMAVRDAFAPHVATKALDRISLNMTVRLFIRFLDAGHTVSVLDSGLSTVARCRITTASGIEIRNGGSWVDVVAPGGVAANTWYEFLWKVNCSSQKHSLYVFNPSTGALLGSRELDGTESGNPAVYFRLVVGGGSMDKAYSDTVRIGGSARMSGVQPQWKGFGSEVPGFVFTSPSISFVYPGNESTIVNCSDGIPVCFNISFEHFDSYNLEFNLSSNSSGVWTIFARNISFGNGTVCFHNGNFSNDSGSFHLRGTVYSNFEGNNDSYYYWFEVSDSLGSGGVVVSGRGSDTGTGLVYGLCFGCLFFVMGMVLFKKKNNRGGGG